MTKLREPKTLDLSVLISTRNRAAMLRKTLQHFQRLELNGLRWEVIVVDNGSCDETAQVLDEAADCLPLVALQEPTPGKNRALNQAVAHAQGELLVFTDDDVIPQTDWLTVLWSAAERWPNDVVFGGAIRPAFPARTPTWMCDPNLEQAQQAFCHYGPSLEEGPVDRQPFGANLALQASVFETMRYNEQVGPAAGNYIMGSETELLNRLRDQGKRFVFVPSAVIEHVILPEQTSFRWLYKRAFRFGRGAVQVRGGCDAPHWFGVPRYVWRRLLRESVQWLVSLPRGAQARYLAGMRLHKTRGAIYEYRLLYQEREKQTTG